MTTNKRPLALEIETFDIGATHAVRLSMNGVKIAEFRTHTKYEERSLDEAEILVAKALGELVDMAVGSTEGFSRCDIQAIQDGQEEEFAELARDGYGGS